MLKVSNLTLSRGGRSLVNNLNFKVKPGEALLITGVNGSGKSTLASVIAGNFKADSGSVEISGRLGVLLQNIEIDFPILVDEFIDMAGMEVANNELINRLISEEIRGKKITQLSVGQLQRVEIAQVLRINPDLYILDEPFSAQDKENTELLIEIFKKLKTKGKGILIINHIQLNLDGLIDEVLNLS